MALTFMQTIKDQKVSKERINRSHLTLFLPGGGNRISLGIQINPTAWFVGLLFGVHHMERGRNQQTWQTCSSLFILQMEKKSQRYWCILSIFLFPNDLNLNESLRYYSLKPTI